MWIGTAEYVALYIPCKNPISFAPFPQPHRRKVDSICKPFFLDMVLQFKLSPLNLIPASSSTFCGTKGVQ